MKRYVVGFLFSADGNRVVLVLKSKPAWQRGRLNGVGGKVEPSDASMRDAMIREWREETGDTSEIDWRQFCTLASQIVYDPKHDQRGWEIAFFAAVGDADGVVDNQATGEETLALWYIDADRCRYVRPIEQRLQLEMYHREIAHAGKPVPNLAWLLPMAWNFLSGADRVAFDVKEVQS